MAETGKTESGVRELIDRLHGEGVEAGRAEAQRITEEAQRQAAQILSEARTQADAMLDGARRAAEAQGSQARESLELAFRDALLSLKEELGEQFARQVRALVRAELRDPELLRKLILELGRVAVPDAYAAQPLEILVPVTHSRAGREEQVLEPGETALDSLIAGISADMLREGVELRAADPAQAGLRVRVVGEDVAVDFTDEAVGALLLHYLLPRFRALLDGLVE